MGNAFNAKPSTHILRSLRETPNQHKRETLADIRRAHRVHRDTLSERDVNRTLCDLERRGKGSSLHLRLRDAGCAFVMTMLLLASGCLPYTTGRTAATTPREQIDVTVSTYVVTPGLKLTEEVDVPAFGVDLEARYGIDDWSDLGFRVTGISGLAVTYKRQLQERRPAVAPITSLEVGGGFVNGGDYGLVQAMLITSTREALPVAPYFGIRSLATTPFVRGDSSFLKRQVSIGGFAGARLRSRDFSIIPEIGVFYSPLPELRRGKWIAVPSISFSGVPFFGRRRWPIPLPR